MGGLYRKDDFQLGPCIGMGEWIPPWTKQRYSRHGNICDISKHTEPVEELPDLDEMGSWDKWAKMLLTRKIDGVRHCAAHHGGIFGLDGKIWAGTDSLMNKKISPQSFKKVHDAIQRGAASVSKLEFADKKFFVLKNDAASGFVIGKSTKKGAGVAVAKARSCFVVGIYDTDQVQPANNTSQVCSVRDQLMNAGY